MRIEEGKFYRTRDGRKVGPMRSINQGPWKWTDGAMRWTKLGGWSTVMGLHPLDIVAPWLAVAQWFLDTPARPSPIVTETVTVRRLEPGVYGRLRVSNSVLGKEVCVKVEANAKGTTPSLNAPELRELARVALEIAEYLDAQ